MSGVAGTDSMPVTEVGKVQVCEIDGLSGSVGKQILGRSRGARC